MPRTAASRRPGRCCPASRCPRPSGASMSVGYVAVYTTTGGGKSCTTTATSDISGDCFAYPATKITAFA